MIVLSFDTSLAACSAAIVDVGETKCRVLAATRCEPGKGHAEILLSLISQVMSSAAVEFADINCLVVTRGPGSFTGVRVALSAARGFRIAHNIPICAIATTQAIAANITGIENAFHGSPTAVIIDARRNEAYCQIFDGDLKPITEPEVRAVDDLGDMLKPWRNKPLNILGTGVHLINRDVGAQAEDWFTTEQLPFPDAANFASFTTKTQMLQTPPDPLYLRKPDAKPQTIGLPLADQTSV